MKTYLTILKRRLRMFLCLFIFLIITTQLSGCISPNQNIENASPADTFEADYIQLEQVANYLLDIKYDIVTIRSNGEVLGDFGEKFTIENSNIRNTIDSLFKNGYLIIIKNDSTVKFERWKKGLSPEFRAGFAYDEMGKDNINIQYLIDCKEMHRSNWYYFELDYNEWRTNNYNQLHQY